MVVFVPPLLCGGNLIRHIHPPSVSFSLCGLSHPLFHTRRVGGAKNIGEMPPGALGKLFCRGQPQRTDRGAAISSGRC
jgi:hypothetical protein